MQTRRTQEKRNCTGIYIEYTLWPNFKNAHQCLNVKEYHANETMARSVEREEVDEGILFDMGWASSKQKRAKTLGEGTYHWSRKWTIEPSSALANQFYGGLGDICFCLAWLDISQGPAITCLCNKLETEDAILSCKTYIMTSWKTENDTNTNPGTCSWWKYSFRRYPFVPGDQLRSDLRGSTAPKVVPELPGIDKPRMHQAIQTRSQNYFPGVCLPNSSLSEFHLTKK